MKILIISPGKLPVPAVNGGAVENLIQQLIDINEKNYKYDYTLISIYDSKALEVSKKYKYTKFQFIYCNDVVYKISRIIRYIINRIPNIYIGNAYIHRVKKLIDDKINDYDYILIENSPEYGLILESKRLILHMHNDFLNKDVDMAKKILNKYGKVLSLSKYINSRIKEIDKNYKNVYTLYNGIDTKKFDLKKDMEILKKHNLNDNDFIFLYTGRIVPEKGVFELIKAFKKIENDNMKLVVVGDLINKKSYINKIRKEKTKNIIFTGKVDYTDIPKYYSIANVGIVPSIWEEPFALTVVEHMASGHPVIITKSGAMPELVTKEVSIIVNKDDNTINNLAEAMYHIYTNNIFNRKKIIKQSLKFDSNIYCDTFDKYILGDQDEN